MTGKPPAAQLAYGTSTPCRSAWISLLRFTLSILLIGLLSTLLFTPWVKLPAWKVFRRSASIAAALSLWLCATLYEHRSLRSYGLAGAGKRPLLFGLLLGTGALALLFAVGLATGICRIDLIPDRLRLWSTLIGFLPAALLVGLLEELVFRGFILQHLLPCSRTLAVVGSSAAYALVHLKSSMQVADAMPELVGLFLLGGVLAVSYLKTNRLYCAIGLHAVLAYGARINKLVVAFQAPELSWLIGTSRLVNGVASWIVLLGIGALIVRWAPTDTTRAG